MKRNYENLEEHLNIHNIPKKALERAQRKIINIDTKRISATIDKKMSHYHYRIISAQHYHQKLLDNLD